jgi:hypothetical protein
MTRAGVLHEFAGEATPVPFQALTGRMEAARPKTDWSVLSTLLRLAQREGWRVEFDADQVQVSSRRAQPGVIVLPSRLIRHARASGWQEAIAPGRIGLRHPAVRQAVTLRLAEG